MKTEDADEGKTNMPATAPEAVGDVPDGKLDGGQLSQQRNSE